MAAVMSACIFSMSFIAENSSIFSASRQWN
jgi:hypothetical protein